MGSLSWSKSKWGSHSKCTWCYSNIRQYNLIAIIIILNGKKNNTFLAGKKFGNTKLSIQREEEQNVNGTRYYFW